MIELDPFLTPDHKTTLGIFAKAIVDGEGPEGRPYYHGNLSGDSHAIDFLAKRVEELSNGQQTVREADHLLFNLEVMGPATYMVRCAFDTPSGVVADLTDDMLLFIVTRELHIPIDRSDPAYVEKTRETQRKSRAVQEEIADSMRQANIQQAAIRDMLLVYVRTGLDTDDRVRFNRMLQLAQGDLTDMLTVCKMLRVDFDEIVAGALAR